MLLVIGSVLLVVAMVLLPLTVITLRRRLYQRRPTLLGPSTLRAGEGRPVTLVGTAVPGPEGPLRSGLAEVECVWHGHEVLRHYRPLNRGNGDTEVRERACDTIADHRAEELFGLTTEGRTDDGDQIHVDPAGTEPVGAELCLKRLVGPPQPGSAQVVDYLLPRVRGRISGVFRGETIEFEYREWVIRPGSRLRVSGVLRKRNGRMVVAAPEDGSLTIEHGVDAQPVYTPARRTKMLVPTAFVVCATAGTVLLLVGLSTG